MPNGRGVRLNLYDGSVDEWDTARPGSFYKVAFGSYAMNLTADEDAAGRLGKKLKEMTLSELTRERVHMRRDNIDPLPITLEFHRRIASSFATVVFTLFGLAMGLQLHHHERLMIFEGD